MNQIKRINKTPSYFLEQIANIIREDKVDTLQSDLKAITDEWEAMESEVWERVDIDTLF